MEDFFENVIMDNILLTIVVVVIGIGIIIALSKALCIYVRKPLVEFCNARGLSASPWLTLIIIGVGIFLLSEHYEMMYLDQYLGIGNHSYMNTASRQINEYGGIALIVLPLVVLLIRTRKYFIPVLLIKIVCLPLDILYALHGGYNFVDARPLSKDAFRTGGFYVGKNGKRYDASGSPIESSNEENYSDSKNTEKPYRDNEYADYGSYSETEERTYSGDYVPYMSEGEVTEIRTYDSDYSSMD